MPKRLILILLFILAVFPDHALAQNGVKLESVNIELWSEFDRPSMLVINEFVVAQNTPLPAKVKVSFPKGGNLIAVAFDNNGKLINTQFETPAQEGDWQTVTVSVESYVPYRIEYYQTLEREGNQRTFKFDWLGDYAVNKFDLTIILPADSTELNTIPTLPKFELSPDSRYLRGNDSQEDLKVDNPYQFEIKYQRATDDLTDPGAENQVQPSEPLGADTPGRVSVDQLPWIIGGVGIAMIGFALIFYWRSLRTGASHSAQSGRRRGRTNSTQVEDEKREVYCHECGSRSNPGDRFCRTCGSKLRLE